MIFDKTKAMRNAERYLSQGKIRNAIGEYKQVVDHDPKDYVTMNMLGDLYIKASEQRAAVGCYTSVAEYYSKQGFAQKAIAIYNKISKLEPGSVSVSEKLAELYKMKGSITEARSHYAMLAEHYQSRGRKIEALAMWKQIALLDVNNTEVYLRLAESYIKENQTEDAVESFTEAALRLAKQGKHEEAIAAFTRALDIRTDDQKALSGFVASKFALKCPSEAAEKVSSVLEKNPFNRDVLFLLIDCQIEAGNAAEAEKAVIKLVEQEPANYPKFLELANIYLKNNETDSATRVLSMSSEHLLIGGQADDFYSIVTEILSRDSEQIEALRLLARYCSWQRDEKAFRDSLEKLASVAKAVDSVDDERYALSQLVMIVPQERSFAERLREINEKHGYEQSDMDESLFDKQFLKESLQLAQSSNGKGTAKASSNGNAEAADFAIIDVSPDTNGKGSASPSSNSKSFKVDAKSVAGSAKVQDDDAALRASEEVRLQKEIDSIKFYIESGYGELAEKAIHELRGEFGDRSEIRDLQQHLSSFSGSEAQEAVVVDTQQPILQKQPSSVFDIGEFRSELGLEDANTDTDSDYETHYHTAIAYQEMGLLEQAIAEFQDAANLVSPNDGTRRFFQCANLLGHCFMQNGMPKLALKWYLRTLETVDLTDEEKQGLWYELAGAYEAEGDLENAGKYFEQVYAENVDFRDVSERVKNMMVHH